MQVQDSWGRDPTVQMMRRVFSSMEKAQSDLLDRLHISAFDERLGPWRRRARALFERGWAEATQKGIRLEEAGVPDFYLQCLAHVMAEDGVRVPDTLLPSDDTIDALVKEIVA